MVNKYIIDFILLPNNRLENSFYKFISIRSHAWLGRRKQCPKNSQGSAQKQIALKT